MMKVRHALHKLRDSHARRAGQRLLALGCHFLSHSIDHDPLRIKCFTQAKNEVEIIEDWIVYHAYLFGWENVYVMDDGSTDGTLDVLDRYRSKINIIEIPPQKRGLPKKLENFTEIMHQEKHGCDFLIPLDTDEFVALEHSTSRQDILAAFSTLPNRCWGVFKFDKQYESCITNRPVSAPICEITRFNRVDQTYRMKKVFFRADAFDHVGFGQHQGYATSGLHSAYITRLWLYHFKWRGGLHVRKKIENNAKGYSAKDSDHRGGRWYRDAYERMTQDGVDGVLERITGKQDVLSTELAQRLKSLKKTSEQR